MDFTNNFLDAYGQFNPSAFGMANPQTPIGTPMSHPTPFTATPMSLPTPQVGTSAFSALPSTNVGQTPAPTATIQHGIVPTIQNVVSTANLNCQLNLRHISTRARNVEYNPKRFSAAIMRIKEPKTTALLFQSGKIVCTGAKSEEKSKDAARKYARLLKKLEYNVRFTDFKIQNIVGSTDVGFPIGLERLHSEHYEYCSYEPEYFPGLIYRMMQPKLVLLIFVSGKIVLTGAKERDEIYRAFDNIYPVLLKYKKDRPASALQNKESQPVDAAEDDEQNKENGADDDDVDEE